MKTKRLIAALLSAALTFQAPGFPAYQAFAANNAGKGTDAPITLTLPTVDSRLPALAAPGTQLPGVNSVAAMPGSFVVQTLPTAAVITAAASGNGAKANVTAAAAKTTVKAGAAANAAASAAEGKKGVSIEALKANESVQAVTNTDKPAGHDDALRTIYDKVGPHKGDKAVFSSAEGPVYHMEYHPANKLARSTPQVQKGKTPVHVLLGSGNAYGRMWSSEWAGRSVNEISENEIPGLKRVIVDSLKNKPAGDDFHFIEADLSELTDENKEKVAQKVVEYLQKHDLQAMGANSFVQGYVRWAPIVQEAIRQGNNPSILVNPFAAVNATVDKLATRVLINEQVESLKWPSISPGTIDDADILEKSVAAYREMIKDVPSGQVVVKLQTAAGKAGLRVGIGSEQELRDAVSGVIKEVKEYWGANPAMRALYIESEKNGATRILIEGMIDRLVEVDVELTVSVLESGVLDVVGFVIGNPAPGEKEKGYLFGMNGLLSAGLQKALILSATEAVVATWKKSAGLPFGNFHVEMILRGDPSEPVPSLVEINATRPIGGNGVRLTKEWHDELDLIRNGLRASLGLPQIVPAAQPQDSLLLVGVTPAVTGTVTKVVEDPSLNKVKFPDFGTGKQITKTLGGPAFLQLSEVGEKVEGADGPHAGALAAMGVRGKDAPDAVKNLLDGLKKAEYEVTKEDGTVRPQKAGEEHSASDYRALPEAKKDELGLTADARKELDNYEGAQLNWTPIFMVYMPLFAAFMNAMGGLAAIGVGRLGYTLALFVSSPFASVLSSRKSVRDVLKYTWMGRVAIWSLLVPAAVIALPAGTPLITALFALNFLDGLMVSFSHPVDIDAGGLDELAKQKGFADQMTPEVRKHYFARYSAFASKARMIYPLGLALAITALTSLALPVKWAFLAGMAGVFLVQGGRAIRSISKITPGAKLAPSESGIKAFWGEFTGGVKDIKEDRKVLGLVSLEALERSMGDVLFMVAFPMLGLFALKPILGLDDSQANLAATVLASIMSYAALKATVKARKDWKAPEKGAAEDPAYQPLYNKMLKAGLTTLSIPAAYFLIAAGTPLTIGLGIAAAIAGAVAFMFAFKPAQIGAMNMMQTAAAEHKNSTQIFGVSSAVQMLFAGAAVWALGSLFSLMSPGLAFLSVSAFFIAVGAAYLAVWPKLTTKQASQPEKKA
jgi:hypothetical protein